MRKVRAGGMFVDFERECGFLVAPFFITLPISQISNLKSQIILDIFTQSRGQYSQSIKKISFRFLGFWDFGLWGGCINVKYQSR